MGTDLLVEKVNEGADAGGEVLVADENGVDQLDILRIETLQNRDKTARIDVGLDMELTNPH
jgi:hypothetical protein